MGLISKSTKSNVYHFVANMGSCECGDVSTLVLVDSKNKTVYTINPTNSYKWMNGYIIEDRFEVPYSGSIKIGWGYIHRTKNVSIRDSWNLMNKATTI